MSLSDLLKRMRNDEPIAHLVPRITAFIQDRILRPSFREEGVWHPSQMGEMCPRREVIARLLPKDAAPKFEMDSWLYQIMELGHWVHRGYQEEYLGPMRVLHGRWRCSRCHHEVRGLMPQDACSQCQWKPANRIDLTPKVCVSTCGDYFKKSRDESKPSLRGGCLHCGRWGRWEYLELPVRHTFTVGESEEEVAGHIDGLIDVGRPDGLGILDIKSINPRSFPTTNTIPGKYRDQLQLYLGASPHLAERFPELGLPAEGVRWGMILFVNKSPTREQGHEKEIILDRDEKEFEAILSNPRRVREALDANFLPDRLEECISPKSKRAKGCDVCDACFACDEPEQVRKRTSP